MEKRADGRQSVVEVEESRSFHTVLHVLRDFQKIPKTELRKFKTSPLVSAHPS